MSASITPEVGGFALERGSDAGGGVRDFVDNVPVHCGEVLELLLEGGGWMPVRYEVIRVEGRIVPRLHFVVKLAGKPKDTELTEYIFPEVSFSAPTYARFRWPRRGAR